MLGRCLGADDLGDSCVELGASLGELVTVVRLRDLLHVLREGAVRARRAIRRRPSSQQTDLLRPHVLHELERQPRLADSGRAENGDEVRTTLGDDAFPDPCQDLELARATDHRNARQRPLAGRHSRTNRDPGRHRVGLPLCLDGLETGLVLDHVASAEVRVLADENCADRCCGLKTRGGVDDVARDHRLALADSRFELDDRLTGVDGDPHLEPVLARPVSDCERGANRALVVVAECSRRAEDAHHRVADELLDPAPETLELGANALVVRRQDRADVLGIELLGA